MKPYNSICSADGRVYVHMLYVYAKSDLTNALIHRNERKASVKFEALATAQKVFQHSAAG